mgnify:CR=1 FL=1
MPWPRAILFDFDGVIVNSEPLHFQAFQETLAGEGIPLSEQEYFRELIGFDDRGAFHFMFRKHGRPLDEPLFLRLMAAKKANMRQLIEQRKYQALPGVEDFVRGLSRNYPLAICSGALGDEIEAMLRGVNLRGCFGVIVSAEDVRVGKPDPEGYLLTMRLLAEKHKIPLGPSDCLIVEDAPSVARNARAAGFRVLAVANSFPIEKLAEADWAVPSLRPDVVRAKIPDLEVNA